MRRVATMSAILMAIMIQPGTLWAQGDDVLDDDLGLAELSAIAPSRLKAIVFPVPNVNPTTGAGLGVLSQILYRVDAGSPPSSTAPFATITSNGSWLVAVDQQTHFAGDRWRANGALALSSVNVDYFGVGTAAGDRGISVDLLQEGILFAPEVLTRVVGRAYAGIRVEVGHIGGEVDAEDDSLATALGLPAEARDIDVAGSGAALEWDTRDQPLNTQSGAYVGVRLLWFAPAVSSLKSFQLYRLAMNGFHPLRQNLVLAARAQLKIGAGDVPVYYLPNIADRDDLRGYEGGRLRDKVLVAAQAELRWQMKPRWGVNAFAGGGGVARSLGALSMGDIRGSLGTGARYLVAPAYRVNLSADVALGRYGPEFYLYLAEAF